MIGIRQANTRRPDPMKESSGCTAGIEELNQGDSTSEGSNGMVKEAFEVFIARHVERRAFPPTRAFARCRMN